MSSSGIFNPYEAIAKRCKLSETTIRSAFGRKPIAEATARRIANILEIPLEAFVLKVDKRGRKPKSSEIIAKIREDFPV